jgi:hypothetical protein
VTVATNEQDGSERLSRRATALRRRRAAVGRSRRTADAPEEGYGPRAGLKLAAAGAVCLVLGVGVGYVVWGTRTSELARQVASLKRTMAEHARDAIADWTELEGKLRAAEVEIARLRALTGGEPPLRPAADLTGGSRAPRAAIKPEAAVPAPSPPPSTASGEPAPDGTTLPSLRRETSRRSEGRPRPAPLELPPRRLGSPPEVSGALTLPAAP